MKFFLQNFNLNFQEAPPNRKNSIDFTILKFEFTAKVVLLQARIVLL